MPPDERFGPAPERADQMSPFERGYRMGYAEGVAAAFTALIQKASPASPDQKGD